jgi:hypothetical protein
MVPPENRGIDTVGAFMSPEQGFVKREVNGVASSLKKAAGAGKICQYTPN